MKIASLVVGIVVIAAGSAIWVVWMSGTGRTLFLPETLPKERITEDLAQGQISIPTQIGKRMRMPKRPGRAIGPPPERSMIRPQSKREALRPSLEKALSFSVKPKSLGRPASAKKMPRTRKPKRLARVDRLPTSSIPKALPQGGIQGLGFQKIQKSRKEQVLKADLAGLVSAPKPDLRRMRDRLQAGGFGPELLVLPSGSFQMGDLQGDGASDERPVHTVQIPRSFALGRYELSVGAFRRFVAATGYRTDAEKDGGSMVFVEATGGWAHKAAVFWRDDYRGIPAASEMPVLHVSWFDAKDYLAWLSQETRERYRLPSEAELEYANRAGRRSRYWWGDFAPPFKAANLAGEWDVSSENHRWEAGFQGYTDGRWGPGFPGQFAPNGFGLYDTTGNLWEWTEDCYHPSYEGAPKNGAAWTEGDCRRRVLRGGGWFNGPVKARSAERMGAGASSHGSGIGFRVARDLPEG